MYFLFINEVIILFPKKERMLFFRGEGDLLPFVFQGDHRRGCLGVGGAKWHEHLKERDLGGVFAFAFPPIFYELSEGIFLMESGRKKSGSCESQILSGEEGGWTKRRRGGRKPVMMGAFWMVVVFTGKRGS